MILYLEQQQKLLGNRSKPRDKAVLNDQKENAEYDVKTDTSINLIKDVEQGFHEEENMDESYLKHVETSFQHLLGHSLPETEEVKEHSIVSFHKLY